MKKLFLIRHAKSSWEEGDKTDFERTLNARGLSDAPVISKILSDLNVKPDLIVSSPALRALTTAQIFANAFNYNPSGIKTDDRIYEAGITELMNVVREFEDNYTSPFLFGHNPGLTNFANLLGDKFMPELPTCGVVGIEFKIDSWKNTERWSGRIILFEYPKKHAGKSFH